MRVSAPKGTRKRELIRELIRSVEGGDPYSLPDGWSAQISWSNGGPMKTDEWSNALSESAASSEGFDLAVIGHLRTR